MTTKKAPAKKAPAKPRAAASKQTTTQPPADQPPVDAEVTPTPEHIEPVQTPNSVIRQQIGWATIRDASGVPVTVATYGEPI